jgi:protein-arginine kinase activator protein McsA
MLCAKCNQKNATVHITSRFPGRIDKIDLCNDCAALAGLPKVNPADLANVISHSIIGKKCEFCGKDASSGVSSQTGKSTYWCFDCGLERSRIQMDMLRAESPELFQQPQTSESPFARMFDSEWKAKAEARSQKATQLLKDRRKQDDRDPGSHDV